MATHILAMVCGALLELVVKGLGKPMMDVGHDGQWEEPIVVRPLVCGSAEFEILYAQMTHEDIQILRSLVLCYMF